MADASLALQIALYARLSAVEGVSYEVWDNRTAAGNKPYLIIGEDTLDADDTTCDYGYSGSALIRCFAEGSERDPSKTLSAQVLEILRPKLDVQGFQVVTWTYEGTVTQAEENGLAHQRIISFRVLMRDA